MCTHQAIVKAVAGNIYTPTIVTALRANVYTPGNCDSCDS